MRDKTVKQWAKVDGAQDWKKALCFLDCYREAAATTAVKEAEGRPTGGSSSSSGVCMGTERSYRKCVSSAGRKTKALSLLSLVRTASASSSQPLSRLTLTSIQSIVARPLSSKPSQFGLGKHLRQDGREKRPRIHRGFFLLSLFFPYRKWSLFYVSTTVTVFGWVWMIHCYRCIITGFVMRPWRPDCGVGIFYWGRNHPLLLIYYGKDS